MTNDPVRVTGAWSRGWVKWLGGVLLGSLLGLSYFVVGVMAILFAAIVAVLAVFGRWSLAFVSGILVGIGGLWLGLMLRVRLWCAADPSCLYSAGTEVLTWLGIGLVAVGLGLAVVAWQRSGHRSSV